MSGSEPTRSDFANLGTSQRRVRRSLPQRGSIADPRFLPRPLPCFATNFAPTPRSQRPRTISELLLFLQRGWGALFCKTDQRATCRSCRNLSRQRPFHFRIGPQPGAQSCRKSVRRDGVATGLAEFFFFFVLIRGSPNTSLCDYVLEFLFVCLRYVVCLAASPRDVGALRYSSPCA